MSATGRPDGTWRIIVVDDEESIRDVLKRLLARLPSPPPTEIVTAKDAQEAIALLETGRFSMIVTDYAMPGRDGISLLAEVRERWPGCLRMLMTGYTDEGVRRDAHARGGIASFIQKPMKGAHLLQTVHQLLSAEGAPA